MPPSSPTRPLAAEIAYVDPVAAAARLGGDAPGTVLLDSALVVEDIGRYSFLCADPFLTVEGGGASAAPLAQIDAVLRRFPLETMDDLPPFQGGLAGYLGYELAHHLERIPQHRRAAGFPELQLGAYDVVVAWDHAERRAWILSSGVPATAGAARRQRARDRLAYVQACLADVPALPPVGDAPPGGEGVYSDFERPAYEAAVGRVIEHILAGDVFQVNLAQRFEAPLRESPFELYRRLRAVNPAPFAAYVDLGGAVVASASPERFLMLQTDGRVETRPIKGTRPRGRSPEADAARAHELQTSAKDRAENVMIVDLLRNDLSRVCRDHSVEVPSLCVLESYQTVHHLVSTVVGRMRPGLGAIDLLRAAFPGGSITGAPKIRAMEIIAELEPIQRGPYTGSVGYLGFDGAMDSSIAIRTFAIRDGRVSFHAGGGIVADSDPEAEYEETLDKARALLQALGVER